MMILGSPRQLMWQAGLLLIFLSLQCLHAQENDVCGTKISCKECIRVANCKWCSKLNASSTGVQCFANSTDLADICFSENSTYVENPVQDKEITKDEPIREADENNRRPIQLKPQEVKITLRRGKAYSLDVQYVQAEDYPVDLYYLMDLSNSMKDDKENVAKLGKNIADRLLLHTKKVRLGFGSFIDKVALPYVDMQPQKLENPCTSSDPCSKPYSFKNALNLTESIEYFEDGVNKAEISGNIDSPEGGFDGLMQVMKCKEHIGWDDNVRKIIVFSTDASFHFAGDGKLAGVVIPNDEKCHLDHNGVYTDFLKYDYPSVSQINKVTKEENINIIFAIANSKHNDLYKDLSSKIEASSSGLLNKASTDIVNLVEKQYLAITSKIEIKDNTADLGGQLALEVEVLCPGETEYVKKRSCDNLQTGSIVNISLIITLLKCPEEKQSDPIELLVETAQDNIRLLVDTECQCGCESIEDHPLNQEVSSECGEGGSLTCGVCNCAEDFYGKNCQCKVGEGHKSNSTEEDKKNCFKDGDETAQECSGNGHCSCGQCECKEGFSGGLCECNKRQCFSDTSKGEVCSGHGNCECDQCTCYPGRNGSTCECPDESACRAPGQSKLCSGEGTCECGVCKCKADSKFYGKFCDDCPTCSGGLCKRYRYCAQWLQWKTGEFDEEDFKRNCSSKDVDMAVVEDLTAEENLGGRLCKFTDEEDYCLFSFTYRYISADKPYIIRVKELKDCPPPPNILAITIGVIASIVAVGLLTLLIWKLLTTLHDQREYAKFQDEMNKSKWQTEQNPLYHAATTTVQNPAFNAS